MGPFDSIRGGFVMKIKHMKKTAALLISASLVTGLCVSSVGADDDSAVTISQEEISENTSGYIAWDTPRSKLRFVYCTMLYECE